MSQNPKHFVAAYLKNAVKENVFCGKIYSSTIKDKK